MKKMSVLGVAGMLVLAGAAVPALAQSGRDQSAFQIRLGGFFPDGDGEFWDDTASTFTLEPTSDLDDGVVGLTFVRGFGNHLEAGFNLDFYERTTVSSVAGFVDGNGLPIFHDSRLALVPATVDLRFVPLGRYRVRGGGRLVRQPVFYIGGGAGFTFWEYEEIGDFVDFSDDTIFFDRFTDDGASFEVHGLAGVELPIGPAWNLLFEGRYSWVDETLGRDFSGLGEIDLGGMSAYVGASLRF